MRKGTGPTERSSSSLSGPGWCQGPAPSVPLPLTRPELPDTHKGRSVHRHEPIRGPRVGRRGWEAGSLGPRAAHPEVPPPHADSSPPAASPSAPDGGSGTWQRLACSSPSGFAASPPLQGTARGKAEVLVSSGMVPQLFGCFFGLHLKQGRKPPWGWGGRQEGKRSSARLRGHSGLNPPHR